MILYCCDKKETTLLRFVTGSILLAGMLVGAFAAAQDPYLRPSFGDREAMADNAGVIPQVNIAMTPLEALRAATVNSDCEGIAGFPETEKASGLAGV